ncbi:MAG TPA: hypothetical protein VGQ44_01405 [Gemmatimonadaceae bacterium]|jgi:hypothetical protein|nr:hypothetical protein [Gemmatimonadaceae bacterium]
MTRLALDAAVLARVIATLHHLADTQANRPVCLTVAERADLRDAAYRLTPRHSDLDHQKDTRHGL